MVQAMKQRTSDMLKHYYGNFTNWDVFNEPLHGNYFEEKTSDPDIRIKMFQRVEALDKTRKIGRKVASSQ